jgi:xanthine dehydrogenase YagS FAD-binding subunit
MNKFAFVDCKTVDEALGQFGGGAMVRAGGIDLLDLMKDALPLRRSSSTSATSAACGA